MKKLIALFAAFTIFASQGAAYAAGSGTEAEIAADAAVAAATESPTPDAAESPKVEPSIEYEAYKQIAGYIADRYIDEGYTTEDIMELGISEYLRANGDEALVALLKSALQSLDDYSDFYTYEEYVEYANNLNQTFYGLGITMVQDGEYVEIEGFVEENGLAEQSGFMIGDKFVEVNGTNVVGSSLTEVRNLIIGELNTTVNITVLRDGAEVELVGTRTAVNTSTVSGGILDGNIGYVKITSFSSNTAAEFEEIAEMLTEAGVENVILDLRDNPGGVVSAALRIAETIVPEGTIIDVSYRDDTKTETYSSELKDPPFKFAVLVNGNTASSAEILASAMQDSGIAELVGTKTYGKGVIQNMYPLNNGMVFKLTVAQYITRNGNEINHIGLTPDIEVENQTKIIDTTGYTKFDFLTPVSLGGSGTNVMAAKERLSVMQYYIGSLKNDVFNEDLKSAIKEFQAENDLTDSGVLDVATQIKLKTVFETLETTVDLQMQEAYKYFGGSVDDLYDDSES